MAVQVEVGERTVRVAFRGLDAFWALSRGLTIPFVRLRAARVMTRRDATRDSPKLRLPGSSLPGVLRAGSYGRGTNRQLWCVHRADEVLALDLVGTPYCRVVLEVDDPDDLARRIGAVVN
jgi:hypothetical protein